MCNLRASQKPVKVRPARASDIQKLTGEVRMSEQLVDSFCGVLDDVPRNSTLNRDRTKNRNNGERYTRVRSWFRWNRPRRGDELLAKPTQFSHRADAGQIVYLSLLRDSTGRQIRTHAQVKGEDECHNLWITMTI